MRFIAGAATALAVAMLLVGLVVYSGVYNVAARDRQTETLHLALDFLMDRSVFYHSRTVSVPADYGNDAMIRKGLLLYHETCSGCHGAPGMARSALGQGLEPHPSYIPRKVARWEWGPKEIFWIVRNGIAMTGMPAWDPERPEEEVWSIVAFIDRRLATMKGPEYRAELISAGVPPRQADAR